MKQYQNKVLGNLSTCLDIVLNVTNKTYNIVYRGGSRISRKGRWGVHLKKILVYFMWKIIFFPIGIPLFLSWLSYLFSGGYVIITMRGHWPDVPDFFENFQKVVRKLVEDRKCQLFNRSVIDNYSCIIPNSTGYKFVLKVL
jgi:hypothetical protein